MGAVFAFLILLQYVLGRSVRRTAPYVQQDAKVVDLTPWKHAKPVGIGLIVLVLILYALFAV
jgi:SSS family solute:Na+ symporter